MKLIVAGGRDFNDRKLMEHHLKWYWHLGDFNLVHGGCRGADELAHDIYTDYVSFPLPKVFPYEKKYGKAGGPIRNAKMAKYGDELLAFWDGKSKGTKDMIDQMIKLRKPYKVVFYDN